MKYNKLIRRNIISLLLAGTLAVSGTPVLAEDFFQEDTSWETEETEAAQDTGAGAQDADAGMQDTDEAAQGTSANAASSDAAGFEAGNEAVSSPAATTDGEGYDETGAKTDDEASLQSGFEGQEVPDDPASFVSIDLYTGASADAYSDGVFTEDSDAASLEDGETLTEEEIEQQLAPIRELQQGSYMDPPSGNGNEDTGSAGATRASSYPAKYDPRSSLGLPVRNQKPSNMCWAYTLAANLEISFLRNGAGLFDLSEEHLAYFFANRVNDPLGNSANDSNNLFRDYRDGGNQTLAAIFLSSWSGMALESQVPYRTNADHTTDYEDTPSSKMAYKTTAYLENAAFSAYSVNKVKNLISEYGSVSMSFGMYDAYYNPHMYAYSYPGNSGVNHAVTLIGWDDNYSKENFNSASKVTSDGAWIARNSWGEDWGDDGYFYISYENNSNYNLVAAEATTSPKYINNYFYDGSCALSKLKLYPAGSNGVSSVANIFQAKAGNGKGEALGEVVLSTYTDGGSYGIQIYTNLTDSSDPTSGTPAYETPVQFYQEHAGISTVQVPEVNLISGTLYSVVITNSGSSVVDYLCETDASYDWVTFQAGLKANQSFCYHPGNGWSDFAKTTPSACVRIKAHTRTLSSEVKVPKPSDLTATAKKYNQINLSWKKASGVIGYQVYRSTSGGKYERIGTVSWENNSYQDKTVSPGISYTYKIRAYSTVNGTKKYSSYTAESVCKTALSVPKVSVSVNAGLYNTITWTKISGASGYKIYRKTKSGGWKNIASVKGSSTTSYKDKKISALTVYEYTVRAYRTVNKKKVLSSYKSSGQYRSAPVRQTISSLKNGTKGLVLKWKAQKNCNGYYIYRKVGKSSYKLIKTIKAGSTNTWTDTKVTKGRKYTYCVRAYVKEPDGIVKSSYKASKVITRK